MLGKIKDVITNKILTVILACIIALTAIEIFVPYDSSVNASTKKVSSQRYYKKSYKRRYKRYRSSRKYRRYSSYRKYRKYSYRYKKRRASVSRGVKRVNVEPIIREVGKEYWPDDAQLDALVWICAHECTTPGVISRTGCKGLFQLKNPPSWMVLGDAASETKAGCEYIKRRYGSPLKAKAFWLSHGWY